jgi:hypothetical protein
MRRGRDARRRAGRQAAWFRVTAAASSAALLGTLGLAGTSTAASASTATARTATAATARTASADASCHLGHGVTHVVELTYDNVHYFRDNPNVPSDLELMPNLLNFFEDNGTFLSNNHTPLIAHTANDLLTTWTGLYGDRQGMPISNSYQAYNADGPNGAFNSTDPASSFAYWTDPVDDTAKTPNPAHDTNPNMVYAPVPPATAAHQVQPTATTPAPWVPFTRAGCDVADIATANQELENTTPDIAQAFGASSPEEQQLKADTDSFKDAETADYVGVAVHCAQGNAFCADAKGVKFGQTSASPTAAPDVLPDEPGGYHGFQALFGHRYVAPQLGAGKPDLTHSGFQVTNAAGNLVDENGNQLNGAFTTSPGFPGFGPINASQTLAYMADSLEAGLPVVNGYIADIHGNENIPGLAACNGAPAALGSGTACYVAQAQYYNAAFGTFFKRLAADGITPANTEFILSSDEGDHEAGANVGRAIQPTPANCNGTTIACTYPKGSFGELAGNITGLLATEKNDTTPFSLESDTAPEFYVTGDPGPNDAKARTLERDVAGLTASNPYAGGPQKITNYLADPAEMAILHMVNADPARTPTFALFAKPDYFFSPGPADCGGGACVTQNTGFAWDHGDYAAEINTNYAAFAGPGVKHLGLDGQAPNTGPSSAGANSGQVEVVNSGTTGTWMDETDLRPTLMYLTGLKDDYEQDGRVVTQILTAPNRALAAPGVAALGACYKQLNSSVGQFGAFTLQASTAAVESSTTADTEYKTVNAALAGLDRLRDALALRVKGELEAAAFGGQPVLGAAGQTAACRGLISAAGALAHRF